MNLLDSKEKFISTRTLFIKDFFSELQVKSIKFCVIRGCENIFINKESDIDILMNPSDYEEMISIYLRILNKYNGKLFTSYVSSKNYYIRSLFVDSDSECVDGLYIHISAYISIKSSQKNKRNKLNGKHVWIDSINTLTKEIDGANIPIPDYKMDVMFLLSAYLIKGKDKYLTKIERLLAIDSVYTDLSTKDGFNYLSLAIKNKLDNNSISKLYDLNNRIVLDLNVKSFKTREYFALLLSNINHLFHSKGKLIFFSGPDGAGKTTANNALTDLLKTTLKVSVYNSKHLYPISNRLSKQGAVVQAKIRNIPLSKKDALERDRGNSFAWKTRRFLGLIYILLQIYPGYIMAKYKNWKGYTVIIDTSFFDAFIKGHRPSFPLLKRFSVPLIPCGSKWYLMVSSPEEIVARKAELTKTEIEYYYKSMEEISKISICNPIEIESNKGELHALQMMIENLS